MEENANKQDQLLELRRIRHEINNVLTGIIGHTQLLLLRGNMDEKSRERVGKIEELSHRLQEIVTEIKG